MVDVQALWGMGRVVWVRGFLRGGGGSGGLDWCE